MFRMIGRNRISIGVNFTGIALVSGFTIAFCMGPRYKY